MVMARCFGVAVLAAALVSAPAAVAQTASPSRAAAAEELFTEGRRLLVEGRYVQACEKLAQSQRLDPSAGTLINLADCHEKTRRWATAWLSFRAAARAAADRGRADWVRLAEKRASALEDRVARVRIDVGAELRALAPVVELDGTRLDAEVVGTAMPVDPGKHVVVVSAPGHQPRSFDVEVPDTAALRVVSATELTRAPASDGAGAERTPRGPSLLVPIGVTAGAVGVAGLVASAVTALVASSALGAAKDGCPTYPVESAACAPETRGHNDDAQTFSTVATVAGIGGAVLLAAGVTLVLVAPPRATPTSARDVDASRAAGAPALGVRATGAGLGVVGTF